MERTDQYLIWYAILQYVQWLPKCIDINGVALKHHCCQFLIGKLRCCHAESKLSKMRLQLSVVVRRRRVDSFPFIVVVDDDLAVRRILLPKMAIKHQWSFAVVLLRSVLEGGHYDDTVNWVQFWLLLSSQVIFHRLHFCFLLQKSIFWF